MLVKEIQIFVRVLDLTTIKTGGGTNRVGVLNQRLAQGQNGCCGIDTQQDFLSQCPIPYGAKHITVKEVQQQPLRSRCRYIIK